MLKINRNHLSVFMLCTNKSDSKKCNWPSVAADEEWIPAINDQYW